MGGSRHRRPADRLGAGADRSRAGQSRGGDGRRLHADRRDLRLERRHRRDGRPHALSGPHARRLRRALLGRPGQLERRDRHRDPAEHRHDPVRRDRRAVDREAVRRRLSSGAADRSADGGVRRRSWRCGRAFRPAAGSIREGLLATTRCRRACAVHAGVRSGRDLSRLVLADGSRRLRLPLCDPGRPLHLPDHVLGGRARCGHSFRDADRANPGDRGNRRAVLLDPDRQRRAAGDRQHVDARSSSSPGLFSWRSISSC